MEVVQDMVFEPTVATLFGARFCGRHSLTALRDAFSKFESGFELAASPLPHLLQRSFCAARSHLLSAFWYSPNLALSDRKTWCESWQSIWGNPQSPFTAV